ncbi:MAG: hypothetical protein AB1Z20_23985 [Desulfobacterales bacterium]
MDAAEPGARFPLMEMIMLLTSAGQKEELVLAQAPVTGAVMVTAADPPPHNLQSAPLSMSQVWLLFL